LPWRMSPAADCTRSGVRRLAAPRSSLAPHSDGHQVGPIGVSSFLSWAAAPRTGGALSPGNASPNAASSMQIPKRAADASAMAAPSPPRARTDSGRILLARGSRHGIFSAPPLRLLHGISGPARNLPRPARSAALPRQTQRGRYLRYPYRQGDGAVHRVLERPSDDR